MKMQRFFIFIYLFAIFVIILSEFIKCLNANHISLRRRRTSDDSVKLEPPRIVIDLPPSVKVTGEKYRFVCNVIGNPKPEIKWYADSAAKGEFFEIVDNDKFLLHKSGDLDITMIYVGLQEVYYCKATNSLGSAFSRKCLISKLFTIPELKIIYDSLEVHEYQKGVISCNVSPDVVKSDYDLKYWEIKNSDRNGNLLQINETSGRFSVINFMKSFQLHIRNITQNDNKNLQARCVVSNRYLENDKQVLDSWEKPRLIYHDVRAISFEKCSGKEIWVWKGSTVELPWCSKPETKKITWYRSNSSSLDKPEKININNTKFKMVDETFGNLLIPKIDFSDEGYYFVKRGMEMLKDYSAFHIRLKAPLRVSIEPKNIEVRYLESVRLICTVSGHPISSINWFHNTRFLGQANRTSIGHNEYISIYQFIATTETVGVYQCVVEVLDPSDKRLVENVQYSSSVVMGEMSPQLVSQIPPINPAEQYSTSTLINDKSVIKIQCIFNSVPKPNVMWYRDDVPIPIVDALSPEWNWKDPFTLTSSLEIDLQKLSTIGEKWKFGGKYRAVVTNMNGSAECTTMVFVTGVFRIRAPPEDKYYQGKPLSLKCYVISESRPEIKWTITRKGKVIRLPENHHQTLSNDKREFRINKLDKLLHEGLYRCHANLKNKDIYQNFSISIAKPPLVLADLPDKIFLGKSDFKALSCHPRQKPDKPWFAWWVFHLRSDQFTFRNITLENSRSIDGIIVDYQKSVEPSDNRDHYSVPEGVPTFLLSHFNQPVSFKLQTQDKFHLSNITCVVQNNFGIIKKSIEIIIINITFENTFPTEMNLTLGQDLDLKCTAKANDLQTVITWQYSEKSRPESLIIVSTDSRSRIHQLSNGQLIVRSITLQDPQRFMCIIKSRVSKHEASKVLNIDIKVPAEILNKSGNIDLQNSKQRTIDCFVRGNRDGMKIEWLKEEEGSWRSILCSEITQRSKDTTVCLVKFQSVNENDRGQYKCLAQNAFNNKQVEETFQINVVDVPERVDIDQKNIIRDRSIYLSWKPPSKDGGKAVTNYLVSYSSNKESRNTTVNKTHINLTNLYPYTDYNIAVQAKNEVGPGLKKEISLRTLEAAPDGPVRRLSAISTSSTSISISWEPPELSLINGIFKTYQYCYSEMSTNDSFSQRPWSSADLTSYKNTHTNLLVVN